MPSRTALTVRSTIEYNRQCRPTENGFRISGGKLLVTVLTIDIDSCAQEKLQLNVQRMLIGFVVLLSLNLSVMNTVLATVVIEWVTVGDPGNAEHTRTQADGTSGYGRVDYEYRIGKYEVTNGQYAEFLNAVATTDTYQLYRDKMGSDIEGGISRSGVDGSYSYTVKPHMGNKPVNHVSWFDAARFANWLHNDQPVGTQNASTTEDGTYTFTGFETVGTRNPGAQFFLPSEHEWQKAAFYQPGAVTSDGDEWWFYGTASDVLPQLAVATPTGDVRNPGPQIINLYHGAGWNGAIYGNVVTVGGSGSTSYYGAYDMIGNVFEWTTADPNKPDPFHVGPYIVRGGSFTNTQGHITNKERNLGPKPNGGGHEHSFPSKNNGFRLASYVPALTTNIPEPATLTLIILGILGVAGIRRKASLLVVLMAASFFPAFTNRVAADTFGSDANFFDIEFLSIGNPGNAPDISDEANPDLPGAVAYDYRIGKYEVSEGMIAIANIEGGLGITQSSRGPDKPATYVNWIEAIKFINWLNTSTSHQAAYKLSGNTFSLWEPEDAGYDPVNPYRNSLAKYFLPSADEWYKAAFYDPVTGDYYNYATGSNTLPASVASGTAPHTAVYDQHYQDGPADVTLAGGLSPYGTMAQSGNVTEMEETDFDMVNDEVKSPRGVRGGQYWQSDLFPGFMTKSYRNSIRATIYSSASYLGFRVASTSLLSADYNQDGIVDGADYTVWRDSIGELVPPATGADGNGDGIIDEGDYTFWKERFGTILNHIGTASSNAVPEPSSMSLFAMILVLATLSRLDRGVHNRAAATLY